MLLRRFLWSACRSTIGIQQKHWLPLGKQSLLIGLQQQILKATPVLALQKLWLASPIFYLVIQWSKYLTRIWRRVQIDLRAFVMRPDGIQVTGSEILTPTQ